MDIPKLIHLVQERPNLYQNCSVRFLTERKGLWKEIATELGVSVSTCRDRWTNLRKLYRQYLIKRERDTHGLISTYKYAEQLTFLDQHIRTQNASSAESSDPHESSSSRDESPTLDRMSELTVCSLDEEQENERVQTEDEERVPEDVTQFCLRMVPIMQRMQLEGNQKKNQIKLDIFQAVVSIVRESFDEE